MGYILKKTWKNTKKNNKVDIDICSFATISLGVAL